MLERICHMIFGQEIAIFHKFQKPPYGGGNQFLLALKKELNRQGHAVGINKLGESTKICLFNSFNFDSDRLSRLTKRFKPRMVHRLAGPIGTYRGTNTGIDRKLWELNKQLADHTIFQSEYSYKKYLELGFKFGEYSIVHNAADPKIFNRLGKISPPNNKRRIKLIASAWSDNPHKGGPLLSWVDEHLDHNRYELTFVGRTQARFKIAKLIDPVPSEQLAKILREHDIYIAPSLYDPCSNALIEALTCGLPAVYRLSGGHPELVKEGGEGFNDESDVLMAIDKLSQDYNNYQSKISNPSITETTGKYLEVFHL